MDYQIELAYGESIGHVIDDVTWPRKASALGCVENVMALDRLRVRMNVILYLDANILKRQEIKDRFQ